MKPEDRDLKEEEEESGGKSRRVPEDGMRNGARAGERMDLSGGNPAHWLSVSNSLPMDHAEQHVKFSGKNMELS